MCLYVLLSWQIPNSNPFAPSLIPSIWPPKVTFRHRSLEEGCLIAFLLCRWAWLLSMSYCKLIALKICMSTHLIFNTVFYWSPAYKIYISFFEGQGPHPGFTLLLWCSIDVGASFGSWCPYCQSHYVQAPLYCTKGKLNWLLVRKIDPLYCLCFVHLVCQTRNRTSSVYTETVNYELRYSYSDQHVLCRATFILWKTLITTWLISYL